MSGETVVEAVADHAVVVRQVEVSGIAVVFPVSHTIANHKALEVGHPVVGASGLSLVDPSIESQS